MKLSNWIVDLTPKARIIIVSGVVVVISVMLYPFQSPIVSEWSLRVIDNFSVPVSEINVTEHWQHYLLEAEGHEQSERTGGDGRVTFPARQIRASLLRRGLSVIGKIVRDGKGARFGTHASVVIWGSQDHETTVAVCKTDEPPPAEIVVMRLR